MTKEIIIILLLIALFYFYQQNQKHKKSALLSTNPNYQQEASETIAELKTDKEILEIELDNLKMNKAELQAKLTNKETELTLILNKWNWGSWKPKSASEFISKFETWIDKNLEQEKEIKEFLKDVKAESLENVSYQLTNLEKENSNLKEKIENLKENKEESETLIDLETTCDQLKRDKHQLEQENIAINSRLKSKLSELSEKEKELVQVKEDFGKKDKSLNDKINEWKKKYQAKTKQLDEEQTNANNLEGKITELETKINQLETERSNLLRTPMPGEWKEPTKNSEWERELKARHELELTQIAKELTDELPTEITGETVLELAKKKKTELKEQPPIFSKLRKKDKK